MILEISHTSMRIYAHQRPFLLIAGFLMFYYACGVDPLNSSGPPSKGEAGYSVCEDSTLPDKDGDGSNDDCEALLATDPNNPDSDGNGLQDGYQYPPLSPEVDCTSATLTAEQQTQCTETGGLGNGLLNNLSESSLLANSGLNASAPNGTQVEVADQFVRIVYSAASNGGLQMSTTLIDFCGAPPFLYYRIEGDVMFCPASEDDGAPVNCEPKSTATHAVMELCGPLPALTGTGMIGTIVQDDFHWTHGKAQNERYNGEFDPQLLFKKKNDPSNVIKLTLTPSDPKFSEVYDNLDVKFEKPFSINGNLWSEDVHVQTAGDVVTLRKFKRTGSITDDVTVLTTPGIVGPWSASD